MIRIINPDKVTRQAFFTDVVHFLLESKSPPTLREIKAAFPDQPHLDRALDAYIAATYIERRQKRYYLNLPLLKLGEDLVLDQMVFVEADSPADQELRKRVFPTVLDNAHNQVLIEEETDFDRQDLTLSNYFYRLGLGYGPSPQQQGLYQLLGDVDKDYALKYMTTFLLKFAQKDRVKNKRPDIFVRALLILGYIKAEADDYFSLEQHFDAENKCFSARKKRP